MEINLKKGETEVKNKIFSHSMGIGYTLPSAETGYTIPPIEFLAQEDITIVGSHVSVRPSLPIIGNDGIAWCSAALGQSPVGVVGQLNSAWFWEWWNTSPAAHGFASSNHVVMYPSGMGITLKEEGRLYLWGRIDKDCVGDVRFMVGAIIYYVKGLVY